VTIGVVIPPVAMNVFVLKNITKMPFGVIYRGVAPFAAVDGPREPEVAWLAPGVYNESEGGRK